MPLSAPGTPCQWDRQDLPLCAWLVSLSGRSSGLIHAVARGRISFLAEAERHSMARTDCTSFACSLGFPLLWAPVKDAAMSVSVQTSLQDPAFGSFGFIPRSGNAGSRGNSIFDVLGSLCSVSRSGCTISYSLPGSARLRRPHILPTQDQLYWRYDDHTRHMDPGYPAQSPLWRGVPSTLDDAMRWSDGASYFFRGQEYWKVLDGELEVAPGYPQSTARDWLVCGDSQADGSVAAGVDAAEGPRAPPGQHDQSRSEDGYEVCSCTSGASSPPGAPGPLVAATMLLLLPPLSPGALWTAAQALTL
ncbi:matrix metalloproteinase-17 isoform X5 [Homo sapiens]|uniref:matrix metalloproteinase-17 isoform X5 n=1 Tax=Homo sapiens TaxID=9606 RepID=UPI0023DE6D17|nr:matrix metalloproteinase-17 isoform X5 [Homo sapiens]